MEDKNKSAFTKVLDRFAKLNTVLGLSVFSLVGGIPEMDGYWNQKLQGYFDEPKKIESMNSESKPKSFQAIIEASLREFQEYKQKMLEGRDPKALPPGHEPRED